MKNILGFRKEVISQGRCTHDLITGQLVMVGDWEGAEGKCG